MVKHTELLGNVFREETVIALQKLFDKAKCAESAQVKEELQNNLLCILQQEKSRGLFHRATSPSGKNHIFTIDNLCLLANINGIFILLNNWLFFDGELDVRDFHWNEEDHLVIFHVCYIVRDIVERCICHFGRDDFFVCFVKPDKEECGLGFLK